MVVVIVIWIHGSVGIFSCDPAETLVGPGRLVCLSPVRRRPRCWRCSASSTPATRSSPTRHWWPKSRWRRNRSCSEAELAAEEEAAAEQQAEAVANLALANRMFWITMYVYGAMVIVALILRWIRLRARRHSHAIVKYLHGPAVEAETGPSLLELSRLSDLPHANLCRGRGRCGTCRVRIVDAQGELSEPTKVERETLARLNAPDDVRLALPNSTRMPAI